MHSKDILLKSRLQSLKTNDGVARGLLIPDLNPERKPLLSYGVLSYNSQEIGIYADPRPQQIQSCLATLAQIAPPPSIIANLLGRFLRK